MTEKNSWKKCFSEKYKTDYWFNEYDGTSVWEEPASLKGENKKRKLEHNEEYSLSEATDTSSENHDIVAIIVPFRDVANQNRKEQLNAFVPKINDFLSRSKTKFKLYIVEQSDDDRKFNRGKLLNIGFDLARKDSCTIFIFHDVDLLPSNDLLSSYTTVPVKNPVHIAHLWDRYNANKKYFGGIVSFSRQMFEAINGFPNNFWGWGGEDDEMYLRVIKNGYVPEHPPVMGHITDLENLSLGAKLGFLKTHQLKCMNKTEVLAEHEDTWRTNGLVVSSDGRPMSYSVLSRSEDEQTHVVHVVADVQLNNHWTDQRSGLRDNQMLPVQLEAKR